MIYQLKTGLSLFIRNLSLCLLSALSLGILISALTSATASFARTVQDQARAGDHRPSELLSFRTAVSGLELTDETLFRTSFFSLLEQDAVTARLYSTLLNESDKEYVITGDERFLPRQMRGNEPIRAYYSASSPPSVSSVRLLGQTIPVKPVDETELFFLTSRTWNPEKQSLLFIYVTPRLFFDPLYSNGLLGSGHLTIYKDFIENMKVLKANTGLTQDLLQATNNEFYTTVSYATDDAEISFMTRFMVPYLSVSGLCVMLVLVLLGSLLLTRLQHAFAVHMLNGATSCQILLQFLVVLLLIALLAFLTAAFLLSWEVEPFFWLYLSAFVLYECLLTAALFQRLKPDRILGTVRSR